MLLQLGTRCIPLHVKVKWSRYKPGLAQRVGRGIALLFHDRGTRRGWVVSSTPRTHFTPGKDPVPILQEAGWAPGPVWTGGNSRPHRNSIPDRPARSQSLYRLSSLTCTVWFLNKITIFRSILSRILKINFIPILPAIRCILPADRQTEEYSDINGRVFATFRSKFSRRLSLWKVKLMTELKFSVAGICFLFQPFSYEITMSVMARNYIAHNL